MKSIQGRYFMNSLTSLSQLITQGLTEDKEKDIVKFKIPKIKKIPGVTDEGWNSQKQL